MSNTQDLLNSCYADFYQSTSIHPKLNTSAPNNNLLDVVSFAPFLMWNKHDSNYFEKVGTINKLANECDGQNLIKECNTICKNYTKLMTESFFSSVNMDIIQTKIIRQVFELSNHSLKINKIKNEVLLQVMNHMWTNFCRFLPYNFKEQIRELDNKVVEYVVPMLIKEGEFYKNYLRDSDRTNRPLIPPPITINNGRKQQLPSFYRL